MENSPSGRGHRSYAAEGDTTPNNKFSKCNASVEILFVAQWQGWRLLAHFFFRNKLSKKNSVATEIIAGPSERLSVIELTVNVG